VCGGIWGVAQDIDGLHFALAVGDEDERTAEGDDEESKHCGDGEGAVESHLLAVAVLFGEEGFGVAVGFGLRLGDEGPLAGAVEQGGVGGEGVFDGLQQGRG